MVVEIFPAQPISRLAAPSSCSTKDSALSKASLETAMVTSSGAALPGGELSAAMLPPQGLVRPYLPGIDAGLTRYGKRFHDKTLGAWPRLTASGVCRPIGRWHGLT